MARRPRRGADFVTDASSGRTSAATSLKMFTSRIARDANPPRVPTPPAVGVFVVVFVALVRFSFPLPPWTSRRASPCRSSRSSIFSTFGGVSSRSSQSSAFAPGGVATSSAASHALTSESRSVGAGGGCARGGVTSEPDGLKARVARGAAPDGLGADGLGLSPLSPALNCARRAALPAGLRLFASGLGDNALFARSSSNHAPTLTKSASLRSARRLASPLALAATDHSVSARRPSACVSSNHAARALARDASIPGAAAVHARHVWTRILVARRVAHESIAARVRSRTTRHPRHVDAIRARLSNARADVDVRHAEKTPRETTSSSHAAIRAAAYAALNSFLSRASPTI